MDAARAITLFCLPHAGGAAEAAYARWRPLLAPSGIDARPLEPPGRGRRFIEPAHARMPALVNDLLATVAPVARSGRRYGFFGHSMGSTVAWALVETLTDLGLPQPEVLVLSGRNPPDDLRLFEDHSASDDATFLRYLQRLGGTPPEFFASSELVAMWLPTLRADYALLGQYRPVQPIRPLDIDLLFLYGEDDDRVDPEGVAGWARYTRGRLIPQAFPGGHFYLQTRAVEVCARIAAHVAASPVRA